MSELVRHDLGGESDGIADLVEVLSELANERFFTMRTRQEEAILRQGIEQAEEPQALDEITNKRIDGNHAFGFQFAERDMYSPLIRTRCTEAIKAEISALTDAHSGMANQEESIATPIVPSHKLLL
jgi:hypothetical protein